MFKNMVQTQLVRTFMTPHHTKCYMFSSSSSLYVSTKYKVSYAQAEVHSQPLVNKMSPA